MYGINLQLFNSKFTVETVAIGTETVSRGLEVNLQIWRLGGHFCGAHNASALPPSQGGGMGIVFHIDL